MARRGRVGEHRLQRLAHDRPLLARRLVRQAGRLQDRRVDVPNAHVLLQQRAGLDRNSRRPVRDQRRRQTALVAGVLVVAKRRVVRIRPAVAAGEALVRVARVARPRLGVEVRVDADEVGAVVAREENQRVVELARRLHVGKEAADVLVDAVDHRRVRRLLERFEPFFLIRQQIPRFDVARRRRERVVFADQAKVDRALDALRSDRQPAAVVVAAVEVLLHVRLGRLQRHVRRVVREEDEVRPARLAGGAHLVDRVVGEGVGGVEVVAEVNKLPFVLDPIGPAGEAVRLPAEEAEEAVEAHAVVGRLAGEVPLAAENRAVAAVAQDARERPPACHRLLAGGVVLHAREDGGAGRDAHWTRAVAAEPHAVCREAVEVRRVDLPAVAAQVAEAQVVGDDQDHVGPRVVGTRCRREGEHCTAGEQQRKRVQPQQPAAMRETARTSPRCLRHQESLKRRPLARKEARVRGSTRAIQTTRDCKGSGVAPANRLRVRESVSRATPDPLLDVMDYPDMLPMNDASPPHASAPRAGLLPSTRGAPRRVPSNPEEAS